jgi:hypothetical protein
MALLTANKLNGDISLTAERLLLRSTVRVPHLHRKIRPTRFVIEIIKWFDILRICKCTACTITSEVNIHL